MENLKLALLEYRSKCQQLLEYERLAKEPEKRAPGIEITVEEAQQILDSNQRKAIARTEIPKIKKSIIYLNSHLVSTFEELGVTEINIKEDGASSMTAKLVRKEMSDQKEIRIY